MDSPHYLSYVLRVWCVTKDPRTGWRASLQDSQTGERLGFASLDALCQFLEQQIEAQLEQVERDPLPDVSLPEQ